MKTLLVSGLLGILTISTLSTIAQETVSKKTTIGDIRFGQQLPPPPASENTGQIAPDIIPPDGNKHANSPATWTPAKQTHKTSEYFRQMLSEKRKVHSSLAARNRNATGRMNCNITSQDFHITRDIDSLADSNPRNFTDHRLDINFNIYNDSVSYVVLNKVAYFIADDGVHGSELWRSDGTATGTYMLKDIEPGAASSTIFNLTALNGNIYFTAYSSAYGNGAWISDGTDAGTQLLVGINEPTQFFAMGTKTYFVADGGDFWSALWETDGSAAGTKQLFDFSADGAGAIITQPTVVNGIFFFTLLSYTTGGWELWRSDGTAIGTYHVGNFFADFYNIPAQLTNYDGALYFSASDGTGRKLWISDGTDAGTKPAPNNHDIIVDADLLGTGFTVFQGNLYVTGGETHILYIYNASKNDGLTTIKDFTADGSNSMLINRELSATGNAVYFKVISPVGGMHDELWTSRGTTGSTRLVYKLSVKETIHNLFVGDKTLYFVKKDKVFGNELWKVIETPFGQFPLIESNIFKGATSSFPSYLTPFNGRIMFSAADERKGMELFITKGYGLGATLVKDINCISTTSSNAGFNFYNYLGYRGMEAIGNNAIFNAYERVHGYELYRSDGTTTGTEILNDLIPGEEGFNMYQTASKNNAVYFSTATSDNEGNYSIYKTNGKKNGLSKILSDSLLAQSFAVTDNDLVFYVRYNINSSLYELWRTNGTKAGTLLLSSSLSNHYYLNVVRNMAFFVAGDTEHGYELWKSDGNLAGTVLVRDINPGMNDANPAGMFAFKNEVYFAAYDGSKNSFWKSNGTSKGTIKLKNIDPWYGTNVTLTAKYYFEAANDMLYFSAIDTSNAKGTQIWKTDGTVAGTRVITDISPNDANYYPVPTYYTNVNGTLFFIGNDGVHGAELWKTDGTKEGTKMVRDITEGIGSSSINGLTNFKGKLYFQRAEVKEDGIGRYYLWTSDGTEAGTHEVEGFGISNIAALLVAGDKLFLTVYTFQYGAELYVGEIENEKLVVSRVNNSVQTPHALIDGRVFPNPTVSNALLQVNGLGKQVSVSIADINGKRLWHTNVSNVQSVNLPVEKYTAGTYFVTVINGDETQTIKLIKQ